MVVTKIKAATQVSKITRVAAYIRVSSDSDDQLHSFSAQYRYYRELFEHSTDEVLSEIYVDEGITGTCTEKRAEFNSRSISTRASSRNTMSVVPTSLS